MLDDLPPEVFANGFTQATSTGPSACKAQRRTEAAQGGVRAARVLVLMLHLPKEHGSQTMAGRLQPARRAKVRYLREDAVQCSRRERWSRGSAPSSGDSPLRIPPTRSPSSRPDRTCRDSCKPFGSAGPKSPGPSCACTPRTSPGLITPSRILLAASIQINLNRNALLA